MIYPSKRPHQDLLKLLLIIYTCLSVPKSLQEGSFKQKASVKICLGKPVYYKPCSHQQQKIHVHFSGHAFAAKSFLQCPRWSGERSSHLQGAGRVSVQTHCKHSPPAASRGEVPKHQLMPQRLHLKQQNRSSSPCLFTEIAKITAVNRIWGRATRSNYPGLLQLTEVVQKSLRQRKSPSAINPLVV